MIIDDDHADAYGDNDGDEYDEQKCDDAFDADEEDD